MERIPNLLAARSSLQVFPDSVEAFLDKPVPSQYNRWTGIAFSDFAVSTREGIRRKLELGATGCNAVGGLNLWGKLVE